ncbi:MAG: aminomethyl-transferring glycine dehydrogenase subunit GcvPA [Candidatus Latescibacteria bacterium]|nr:aminomethyl-transferring glycine dehydrogenase subunit GcvPA [Candidatus Latescibacterota bacterium]NIO27313.1 aminomethyl-transferring glycine dehydrogenase subunit GcvPA [Candidatus Latescibacterota bacterium]NIO54837.1 aminomethyl-transferring glycine dehydrogenase subunit GcvPA [Candidatus Latescibacterota bacterium]NIT00920.1 aminomethyl-transferring glycine dehydrogenase subunit GcvPA [Candidatus Latescibacterota bacterium]NIT37843.1 aminomethyl-transferring glycine dehydrogenase subun
MPYIYHSEDEIKQMLAFLGMRSEKELFERIPAQYLVKESLPIDEGKTESDTLRYFDGLSAKNEPASSYASFLGGGIYDHEIPSVVDHLAGRPEFYTAYTPYQPEVSQGTLQMIFEFQTLISRMVGLPVANASMYDGATALAEAALMAAKITGRNTILVPDSVNPRYREVLKTYCWGKSLKLVSFPFSETGQIEAEALNRSLDISVAAVVVQTPNYFGVLEKPWEVREMMESAGSLLISVVDPISLSLFRPPGDYGADIAAGEGQCLGSPPSCGGPLLGFIASKQDFIRNMPGRIVSRTKDVSGKDAYVLTLQTREQHIRREKATSNICTNQGMLALRATIHLSVIGEEGFQQKAAICYQKAHGLAEMISACPGYSIKFEGPFFREFVVECPVDAEHVAARMKESGILAGIPLGSYFGDWAKNCLLVALTEKRTDSELEAYCAFLKKG